MLIPIKIQCACGQRYAFEVEAAIGCMTTAVACPACGADGTGAANAAIAQSLPAQPAPADKPRIRLAIPASSVNPAAAVVPAATARVAASLAVKTDYAQVQHEARAKVLWGDSREEVLKFLMIQGIGFEEASELVREMFREREATIRGNGIRKIFIGITLACVPIAAYLFFLSIGVISLKLLAITIIVGLYGAWLIFQGTFMVLAPKSEAGDVADQ